MDVGAIGWTASIVVAALSILAALMWSPTDADREAPAEEPEEDPAHIVQWASDGMSFLPSSPRQVPSLKHGMVAAGVASVLGLTACFPNHLQAPMSISDRDRLEIAICEDLAVSRIYAEQYNGPGTTDDVVFVNATLDLDLREGDIVSLRDLGSDATVRGLVEQPEFPSRGGLTVIFEGPGRSVIAAFQPGDSFPGSEAWLQTPGSVTDQPCP